MSETSSCTTSGSKGNAIELLQRVLDKIGVPTDIKWRSLILFMRSIKEYGIYTDEQKRRIQGLLIDILKYKKFSEEDFRIVERRIHDILCESWRFALQEELGELSRFIRETKAMMLRRTGDLEELGRSTVDTLLEEHSMDEAIRRIRFGFQELVAIMEADTVKLVEQSLTDPLTGLGNRRALEALLGEFNETTEQNPVSLGVLMVDVDNFKGLNDTFGHVVGDRVLAALGGLLRGLQRDAKARLPRIVPFRYGGEEFVVVAVGLDAESVQDLAETIRFSVEDCLVPGPSGPGPDSSGVSVTVSVGVACHDGPIDELIGRRLLSDADAGLYAAKTSGRNQVVCAVPSF